MTDLATNLLYYGGEGDLFVVRSDGTGVTELTSGPESDIEPV